MDFSESSATWDDDPTRVDRAARVARAIRSALALDHPRTLEIGCGTGLLARALADQLGPVTLIDSAPGMVEVAAEQARAAGHEDWTATLVSLGTDELPAGPFGLAISQLALHHVHDVPAALSQIYQVLGTGGQIAVADLDHDPDGHFHSEHADFDGHHGFIRDQFAGWLRDAGFADVTVSTATTLTKEVGGTEQPFDVFLATGRRR